LAPTVHAMLEIPLAPLSPLIRDNNKCGKPILQELLPRNLRISTKLALEIGSQSTLPAS